MAVRIEPEATTKARFARELVCGCTPDEVDQPAVGLDELPTYLGERKAPLLLSHPGIESINAAVGDVPRWPAPLNDQRQMLQRLLLPRGYVREDVLDRPIAHDAGFCQPRVRQTGV